jgi:hypothetical protein
MTMAVVAAMAVAVAVAVTVCVCRGRNGQRIRRRHEPVPPGVSRFVVLDSVVYAARLMGCLAAHTSRIVDAAVETVGDQERQETTVGGVSVHSLRLRRRS